MTASSITLKEKIAYACGDTASVLYYRSFAMFLMIFYTDVFGITAAQVSLMFLVTRFWDAINDPLMGMIVDRTNTRHGKFRPWLRWMIIPLAISSVLLFTVPDFSDQGKLIYVWITYILTGMLYTAINIPYGALMGVMSPRSEDRTTLSTFRFYGAYAGDLIVKGSMIWFIAFFGRGNEAVGYQHSMALYALLASILFLFTFSKTKERVRPQEHNSNSNWKTDLIFLLRNRPWIVLSLMGLLTLIWISIRTGATLYYFKYYIGNYENLTSWFLITGVLATFAGVACTNHFTRIFKGKKNCFAMLTLIIAFLVLSFIFIRPTDMVFLFGVEITISFFAGPLLPLFWSMIADTADYGEWKFGRRTTGLAFSAGTFSQKAGWAIGGSIAGYLLSWSGYQANTELSQETLNGIKSLMGIIPSIIAFITVGITFLYNIDQELEKKIERELRLKK